MSENSSLSKVAYTGKINIGNKELSCAVLDNGTRLLTNTAIFKAFDRTRRGNSNKENIPAFITGNNLKCYIEKFIEHTDYSVKYINNGKILTGFSPEILSKICDVYISASNDKVLLPNQEHLAEVSRILKDSLVNVALIALIDEATGYQYEREENELQKILSLYIAEEFLPWSKTFPDEFYIQMFRLRDWDYKGRLKPQYVGQLTNFLVYNRLPKGVLDELKNVNPILNKNGYRKYKLYQGLTNDIGYQHLTKQIITATTMMKGFDKWEEFEKIFRRSYDIPNEEII